MILCGVTRRWIGTIIGTIGTIGTIATEIPSRLLDTVLGSDHVVLDYGVRLSSASMSSSTIYSPPYITSTQTLCRKRKVLPIPSPLADQHTFFPSHPHPHPYPHPHLHLFTFHHSTTILSSYLVSFRFSSIPAFPRTRRRLGWSSATSQVSTFAHRQYSFLVSPSSPGKTILATCSPSLRYSSCSSV